MPYVITIRREVERDYHEPGQGATAGVFLEDVDQITVVTLDEARDAAIEATGGAYSIAEHERTLDQVAALTESGGTVGPLPDGTVIQVEPVTIEPTNAEQENSETCSTTTEGVVQ